MFELVPTSSAALRPLGSLRRGESAVVAAIVGSPASPIPPEELEARLLEMGFVEGAAVEVAHEGPVGRDPVAILLRGCMIALRRQEANAILVQA